MRGERYKTSAGLLTLAVHLLFIGVLYYGVKWQMQQPEGMQVELWSELPQTAASPPPPPPVPAPSPKAPAPQPKAETTRSAPTPAIVLAKQKKAETVRKPQKARQKKPSKAEEKRAQADMQAMEQLADMSDQQEIKAQTQAAKAAKAAKAQAAISSEIEKYRALISSKIRNNVVMPPEIPADATAQVAITLLPDGSVMGDPNLVKSSGYPAYDEAIIRAILKAGTMPLPKDATTRERFINPNILTLKFRAGDTEE